MSETTTEVALWNRELKGRTMESIYYSVWTGLMNSPVFSMFTDKAIRGMAEIMVETLPTHDHAPALARYEYTVRYTLNGQAWYVGNDWTPHLHEARMTVKEMREDGGWLEVKLIRRPIVEIEEVDY